MNVTTHRDRRWWRRATSPSTSCWPMACSGGCAACAPETLKAVDDVSLAI